MPRKTKKRLLPFIYSFLICALLFGGIIPLAGLPFDEGESVAAELPYTAAYDTRHSDIRILVTVDPLPVFFLVTLMPSRTAFDVLCLPICAMQNSTTALPTPLTKTGVADFLGQPIDHSISLGASAFGALVDRAGGITVDTPYGLPAPSGNGRLLAGDEPLHLYGRSVITLLAAEPNPDHDRLLYAAELLALVLKNYLSDFDKESYYFLKNEGTTDISYPQYYDHASLVEACTAHVTFTAPNGVWINDFYYLQ